MTGAEQIAACDAYLGARTGCYAWRRERYRAALHALIAAGLTNEDTVVDVGAGWTEFDYCLRVEGDSRCRYVPVDGCIDGTDLQLWAPPREAEFFVCLEILEHINSPHILVGDMQQRCSKAIVVSTPNPETTDVLGMDPTHKTPISTDDLRGWGFDVEARSFYGQPDDSLFAVWRAPAPTQDGLVLDIPTLAACIEALEFTTDPMAWVADNNVDLADRSAAVAEQLKYRLRSQS